MGIVETAATGLHPLATAASLAELRRSLDARPPSGLRRSLLRDAQQLAHTLHPGDRMAWLQTLRALAAELTPRPALADAEPLIALAARWADWPLVHDLGLRCEVETLPCETECLLLQALHRLGDTREAIARCRSRMLAHPGDAAIARSHAQLCAWSDFVDSVGGAIEGDAIRLEPLGHQHLQEFSQQYADPQIAALCCLPAFRDDRHWHRWLDDCWGHGDERLYAVIHREWGFVGSVSLCRHRELGFFYYWIGRDFRGAGIGPAAVNLLLEDAAVRRGMRTCYAKVFVDNLPSRRALRKLGFEPLDVRAAPPDEREVFYRRGQAVEREIDVAGLRRLFDGIGSRIRIAVPIAKPTAAARVPAGIAA